MRLGEPPDELMEKDAVKLMRAAVVRAVAHRNSLLLFGTDGVVRRLDDESATLARVVLEFAVTPCTRDEILAHLETLSGAPVEHPEVVDQLIELLLAAGALVRAADGSSRPLPRAVAGTRVVVAITGAIAALHTPALVLALQRRGIEVRVAATKASLRFCRPEGLAALTHHPVQVSMWSRDADAPVPHLHLAEWAHAILVCPASATTLSRIARGDCATLVSALAIAARVPVLLVPSMNPAMYFAPSVQRNLELLRADGFHVMEPAMGAEVADAPAARQPRFGAAPPPEQVADVLTALLRLSERSFLDVRGWDELYATTPEGELRWHTAELDEDLASVLRDELKPEATLLDVGTGLGTVAREAARLGFHVAATDVSTVALQQARTRTNGLPITWVRDDITATRLEGQFDVVVDRGCMHVLCAEALPSYAHAMARLTAPGGCLLLKADAETAPAGKMTHRFSCERIVALLGPAFTLVRAAPTRLGAESEASLYVLRRQA